MSEHTAYVDDHGSSNSSQERTQQPWTCWDWGLHEQRRLRWLHGLQRMHGLACMQGLNWTHNPVRLKTRLGCMLSADWGIFYHRFRPTIRAKPSSPVAWLIAFVSMTVQTERYFCSSTSVSGPRPLLE